MVSLHTSSPRFFGVTARRRQLRERTLVALCGGVCKFGNVRFSAGRVEVTGLLGLLTR
jgi:hypothetical protein